MSERASGSKIRVPQSQSGLRQPPATRPQSATNAPGEANKAAEDKGQAKKPEKKTVESQLPPLSIVGKKREINFDEIRKKKISRNAPEDEDKKEEELASILEHLKQSKSKIGVREFVDLVSPFTVDNGELMRKVMEDDLAAFRKMVTKLNKHERSQEKAKLMAQIMQQRKHNLEEEKHKEQELLHQLEGLLGKSAVRAAAYVRLEEDEGVRLTKPPQPKDKNKRGGQSDNERKFYSDREKVLLMSLVEKFKTSIENKKTDGTNLQKKNIAWKKITELYNSNDVFPRTDKQLKKLWDNLKQRTRKTDTEIKKAHIETGGGPPPKEDTDPINEMVRAIVPTIGYVIENSWDSTSLMVTKNKENNNLKECKKTADVIGKVDENQYSSLECNVPSPELDQCEKVIEVEIPSNKEIVTGLNSPRRKKYGSGNTPIRSRLILEEEGNLRKQKLKRSIEIQEELHKAKMEAVEMEKQYWYKRTKLLEMTKMPEN